ncbi:hypothetical protein Lfu02_41370 [Longispora fulva]|uniref:Arsenate reductase n=1 Tax=Longispora fulva TaxID=619741 RepID=A0A8J7KKE4_9ACTN|nr:hypothetical protein [Longispora fulva]MBG6136596.1 hypothetical protein [Longispora fulva]GIG59765.1 hypothetical protein Lfu02_41370 [Longispora fulva]
MDGNLPLIEDSWAPESCTLPTAARPLRVAEFDALFAASVRTVERTATNSLRLALVADPQVAATAAGLVTRETACCSFFTFTLTATGGALVLDVTVDGVHEAVLDALEASARAGAGAR